MKGRGALQSQIYSPGWRTQTRTTVSSKVAYADIYDDLCAKENAISYTVVARNAITDPYLRIADTGGTKYVDSAVPAEGRSS